MPVLIVSNLEDLHAWALRWALKQLGEEADFFSTREMPEGGRVSLSVSAGKADYEVKIRECRSLNQYSSIWLRRGDLPECISELLVDSDRDMALYEANRFIGGLSTVLATRNGCVNPLRARSMASSKFYQLLVAKEVGFMIPDTLMSNNPEDIREFFSTHGQDIIHKPFHPASWAESGNNGFERSFTATLTPEHLRSEDIAFTSCPGIYQACVPKSSELRITFFGQSYFAMRIFSQDCTTSRIDFRADFEHSAPVEAAHLDDSVLAKCKAFATHMGLLHGSFDLIECPDGTLVFLEVNEMGQFLFLEEYVPELRLLAAATEFARNPDPNFAFRPRRETDGISFESFLQSQDYQEFLPVWDKHVERGNFLFTYPG